MCGRFAMTTDPALLAERLGAVDETTADPADYNVTDYNATNYNVTNYNVAPTATIATVVRRHTRAGDAATRRIRLMRWGLVPFWVKADADGAPVNTGALLINARADKVTTSPAFRAAAAHRRCLVPMDGFYEWRVNPASPAGRKAGKTPFYIQRADGAPLLMAGLWSVWRSDRHPDRPPLRSATIITTDAVGELAAVHDRMPLILPAERWDAWLDPDTAADDALLAAPPDVRDIVWRQVSTLVNSVRNNGPDLIRPAGDEPGQPTLL